jgi:Flp pilus assembly protein TadD
MIRRWLRGCLLPTALGLTAVGCTTSVESLTGGLVTTLTPAPKDGGDLTPMRGPDQLPAGDELRLHLETAREMDQAGNDEGALPEYEKVLELDRSNYAAMRRLCVLYDRRGGREDFKKAEELYRKVAAARPKDPDVWSDWGYSLFLRTDKENCKENWAEAEKKLRQALVLNPQHARAHTNLGLVLGQLDRFDEAYREFRAARLSEGEAHCDMAFVYWQKGRLEDAKQECRLARDKDPGLAKANDMLAVLEQAGRPHDKGGPGGRHGPMTAAQEAAEHEAARRYVAGMTSGSAPPPATPTATVTTTTTPVTPTWQSSEPITMPSGTRWMPTKPGATTLPPVPAPAPAPVPSSAGNAGTIEF